MHGAPSSTTGRPGSGSKKQRAQDASIMSTNNSCIGSKRSVERLYHQKDHGFRHFVTKFQRRAPLINRGYWLRMRAIDDVVRSFLQQERPAGIKRAVINLGCGYDILPFKFLRESPELCQDSVFVDVDYDELMQKKCSTIREHQSMLDRIDETSTKNVEHATSRNPCILMSTSRYVAVGCNLTDTHTIDKIIRESLGLEAASLLFVAEVSMTYMKVEAADKVVKWASGFDDAQFCLLEQLLPDGPDTPFVDTMLKHFEKLHSPLQSVLRYPTTLDQENRFVQGGWSGAKARTLWDLWEDNTFLSSSEAANLNQVEPFDEWEEFALFASHYFVLIAKTHLDQQQHRSTSQRNDTLAQKVCASFVQDASMQRRHGASFLIGPTEAMFHGGNGPRGRQQHSDLVQSHPASTSPEQTIREPPQHELVCHTITYLGASESLLVGGRTSPSSPSALCFLRRRSRWSKVADLPNSEGRYRHNAVPTDLDDHAGVLIFGGRTGSGLSRDDWLLWQSGVGWTELEVIGERPSSRFGASMSCRGSSGYLTGGMSSRGEILHDFWEWRLVDSDPRKVSCLNRSPELSGHAISAGTFGRLGARLLHDPRSSATYLVGGVGQTYVPRDCNILKIDRDMRVYDMVLPNSIPHPLLVGHSTELVHDESSTSLVILGGGATCFSFGTYWNEGCYTIALDGSNHQAAWAKCRAETSTKQEQTLLPSVIPTQRLSRGPCQVRRQHLGESSDFANVVESAKPVIVEDLDIGSCTKKWTPEYLKDAIGKEREVIVHESGTLYMSFLDKNFSYKKVAFGDFMDDIQAGQRHYLRALSSTKPADIPSHLSEDFPTIGQDFQLASELGRANDYIHSSPLRISGAVIMWLHYDVMANVLCQVRGRKRLVLFSPHRVRDLDFPPGASSSRLEVFDREGSLQAHAEQLDPIICDMNPGDVLFIPALWAHTAYPTDGFSVAVNVFFRSLEKGYAAGRDTYGNRDVQAYETGRKDVQRMTKAFKGLPHDVAQFYLRRLAAEVEAAADALGGSKA